MVPIPPILLKPPHFFSTFLRHIHHLKPSPSSPPRKPRVPPPQPPPPPPHSLNFKLSKAITKIRKLIKTKELTSHFDTKAPSLYSIFTNQPETLHSMFIDNSKDEENEVEEEEMVVVVSEKEKKSESDSYLGFKRMEEVTPDMKYLVGFLCNEGFLKRSRMFMPLEELRLRHFLSIYSRGWVRKAAQRFGEANLGMVKCLSENDLKTIARFGCSSLANKTTVVAKVVRSYLGIDEVPVCRACKLRKSCKTRNLELVDKVEYLDLGDVMHMLTSYALGLVHHQLTVPDEVKDSTRLLLTQLVQCIQQIASRGGAPRFHKKPSHKHTQRRIRLIMRERIQGESKRRYWKRQKKLAKWKENKARPIDELKEIRARRLEVKKMRSTSH